MIDILCIGDAVVDIFLQIPKDNPHFGLDKEKNKLFIDYGYKINLENYVKDIGGNACNTAVGISRLGKSVGLCAEIGKDEFSQLIVNKLENENINTNFISQNQSKKTSFSVSLNYKGERTLLVEHVQRPHLFNIDTTSARFIYLTSLGNIWENAYQNTLDFIKSSHSLLAFNPGTLQINNKDNLIMEIIRNTDYLFLNKQEAEKLLYGKEALVSDKSKTSIKKLLFALKSSGAKNVILTDSYNGSYVQDEINNIYHLEIVKVEVIEKTGAGDAYTAGFIGAILNNQSIPDAMRWGAVNDSSVVRKIGAQDGLLKKSDIIEKLSSLTHFKPLLI